MNFTFLICSERSGSNLITKIFDNHPNYCGPGPTHLFRILLENRLRYGNLNQPENWQALLQDTLVLFNTKLGDWVTNWTLEQLKDRVQERSLSALLKEIYAAEAAHQNKTGIFLKENHTYRFAPFILAHFPQAQFIYLVRDPRDMALSWKLSPSLRGGVMRAAKVWAEDQAATLNLITQLEFEEKLALVRYEDLLQNHETELASLCQFLAIPFVETMLNFGHKPLTKQNAQGIADWKNLQNPLMTNNLKKYKDHLSKAEIQYIESICQVPMTLLAYPTEFGTYPSLSELEAELSPHERYEKPAYQNLPFSERQLREQRKQVLNSIQTRPIQPVYSQIYKVL